MWQWYTRHSHTNQGVMRGYIRFLVPAAAITAVAALGIPPSSAAVTASQQTTSAQASAPRSEGRAAPLPTTPAQPKHLATLGSGSGSGLSAADASAVAAAAGQAHSSGKPVTVNALTTGTTTVSASPDDQLSLTEHVFPVRVRRGHGWVAVSTTLKRDADGSLSPAAVPGDAVTFSGGGSGPLATISAAGTSLSLSWGPGKLPAPVVSGDTATYRGVLPGVDLVLTATSVQTGGFSEVLVVHNAAAAADPVLAHLPLAVAAHGVRLAAASGGGLVATAGGSGYYQAPPSAMWDSSGLAPSATRAAVNSAAVAARAAGASLAPPGPPSSPTGPGGGARLARVGVGVSGDGRTLSLSPDRAMLTSPSTRWPVYIDPTFEWYTADGGDQAFVPTQSDCPTATNYNNTSAYPATPVGFDNWGGECSNNSTDYSYFRVAVPSAIWGAHLSSAHVNAAEAYSSDCSSKTDVTLSWSGNFGRGTDWDNRPGVIADQDTETVGYDPGSCGPTYDFSSTVGVGFNVLSAMTKAASGHWSAFAFRLWEQNNTNKDMHKQFADQGTHVPYLQILYNYTPAVPGSEKATGNSDGSASAGCDTTGTSPPAIGAISGSGPYLWAHYADADGDEVQGTIRYWKYPQQTATANTALKTASDLPKAGGTVAEAIPAGFYNTGLSDGQVIAWDADATDGTYTSGWSATCYFAAYPTGPAAPTLSAPTPGSDCPGGVITPGCQVTFTITAAGSDPATEFVWELDGYPATTAPPSSEVLAASGSPPSATLTITVPSPGPHNLWVYAGDAGSNDSGVTNGDPPNSGDTTFTAADDPAVSCADFTDALANSCLGGPSSPNTMISKTSGSPLSCGNGTGDGGGGQFDATALASTGWQSRGAVTVDGATFTLPDYGSCQPDNVLAANQTIGMGDAQGSALVFLATSTYASAATSGLTGSPDSGVLAGDSTVPGVPGGIGVTGGGCTAATEEDANMTGCDPATGKVTYASSSCSAPTSFYLSVPDWVTGPGDIAAVSMPDRDILSGQQTDSSKIYAFAVGVDPQCQIASVTLPDVGDSVSMQLNSGSSPATYNPPALHILGMSVRNTTTATPQAGGGSEATPAQQSWTGDWASPVENAAAPPSGEWGNQTLRIQVPVRVSGSDVRIRLSDPGFLAGDGAAPLWIGDATVAVQSAPGSPKPSGAIGQLTFGAGWAGQSVTIPKGGDVYSNPLPFAVTAGENLLVSLYVANAPGSLAFLPEHGWASTVQWVSAPAAQGASGDQTADTSGTPFTATGAFWTINTNILTGVDVTTPQTATNPGGIPTVSVLGDNLIDVNYNGLSSQAVSIPITRLDGELSTANAGSFSVVPGGVNSNEASADTGRSGGFGGVSAVARLDRDVLAEPGIGTVIIDEGLQDLLHGASEQQLEDAYGAMLTELSGFGITVIMGTVTPCAGYSSSAAGDSCAANSTVDNIRNDLNQSFIPSTPLPDCYADFNAAVSSDGDTLNAADDAGDHVNLTQTGYSDLANALSGLGCGGLAANQYPPPP